MISKVRIISFIILFSSLLISAQEKPIELKEETFFNKKNISVMAISGIYAFSLVEGYVSWWKNDSQPFHFYEKLGKNSWFNENNSLGIDKVGHFYTSYFLYKFQKDVFLWGGNEPAFSKWYSALLSSSFAVIIEIGDGFSSFGFDYQDLIFNLAGVGYGLLQEEYNLLKHLNFKWSFFPKSGLTIPPNFTHHYDDHIYWLTADIYKIFGESFQKYWPQFLQPAIGFSVNKNGTEREFVLGLDFNFNFLFNNANQDLKLLGNAINLFHFPAPGVKFNDNAKPNYKLLLLN